MTTATAMGHSPLRSDSAHHSLKRLHRHEFAEAALPPPRPHAREKPIAAFGSCRRHGTFWARAYSPSCHSSAACPVAQAYCGPPSHKTTHVCTILHRSFKTLDVLSVPGSCCKDLRAVSSRACSRQRAVKMHPPTPHDGSTKTLSLRRELLFELLGHLLLPGNEHLTCGQRGKRQELHTSQQRFGFGGLFLNLARGP